MEHFRCYERADIKLGPGLHILAGENASGKTSILEAVYLLGVTKSHRTSADRQLIAWEHDWARVSGVFDGSYGSALRLCITLHRQGRSGGEGEEAPTKTAQVNSVPTRRIADVVGQTAMVLFGPDDLALIKGPPSRRRHFINAGISQVRASYLLDLMRFRRALRQRNECLRAIRRKPSLKSQLAPWDAPLVESGARVSAAREEFTRALSPHMEEIHCQLSGGRERAKLQYRGDLAEAVDVEAKETLMRTLLADNIETDISLGRTLGGPHRDELQVLVEGRPLRAFGSQGQQRTAALSLTLAEAAVMSEWRGEAPIVLLDDCLSELDDERAERILRFSDSVEQMIVTTAAWPPALGQCAETARTYDIRDASIQERANAAC